VLVLLFGSREPTRNIGITLSWYVGWPLLIFSFFFLPRFWCSICTMSAPGKILQNMIKPTRRLPALITRYSAWIMAILCLVLFWVEIVWDAFQNTLLTAAILLSIAGGALLFSLFFERNVWCRYLCPLGALNAIFSMPSILALRANRQLCDNQCREHACYLGTEELPGCPMFRHPFLVDNNRDCTLCGNCIKNCRLHSIQLNLRLAPEELWGIQEPRLADSFLVTALGAVFFNLARRPELQHMLRSLTGSTDDASFTPLSGSLIFWATALAGWGIYCLFCLLHAFLFIKPFNRLASMLGYGLIPLVLGGFLAYYVRMFLEGAWRLLPNLLAFFSLEMNTATMKLPGAGGAATALHLIVLGGLVSSLYAIYRIMARLHAPQLKMRHLVLPWLYTVMLGALFLKGI
jgi:ferredoxin